MNDMTEPVLSETGRARRDEILGVLHGAMAGRVRRRRIVRGLGVMVVAGAGVWASMQLRTRPNTLPAVNPVPVVGAEVVAPYQLRHASLRIIESREHPPSSITIMDDDAMLRALRELGRPTGIIRSGGRVTLTERFWPEIEETDQGDSTG